MAYLTLPNKWGEEGFNVIRKALIEYCRQVHPEFDLGYAFQWDTGTPLIKDSEGLSDDEYRDCSTALAMITNYLHQGMDPWQAVASAKLEWQTEKETIERLYPASSPPAEPPRT
jgi:hypothetical protein